MIGTDLDLDLPSLSDTVAVAIGKIITALSAIEDSIADQATVSALDINGALDMAGNKLVNATGVQLAAGSVPTAAGSFYYSGGEFYLVNATGPLKITNLGQLNASSLGAIGGDYGGTNPALISFDNASGEYRFTEDPGVYADLRADDVILVGSAGTLRLSLDAAISGNKTFNVKSLPGGSSVSMLVYDAVDGSVKDGAVTRATGTQKFTDIEMTGYAKHGSRTAWSPFYPGGNWLVQAGAPPAWESPPYDPGPVRVVIGTSNDVWYPIALGDEKNRILGVKVVAYSVGAASTFRLYRTDISAPYVNTPQILTLVGPATTLSVPADSQMIARTLTLNTPYTPAPGEHFLLRIQSSSSGPVRLSSYGVVTDVI